MTQKAELFRKDKPSREKDMAWIEQKLLDGKNHEIRDISQKVKSTPTKDPSPLSPKRDSPDVDDTNVFFGRGKRMKFHKKTCDLECCLPVRRALFVDDVLEIYNNLGTEDTEEEVVPDDGDPDYIDESESKPKPKSLSKTQRPNFEHVIALQERFNTPDTQVALWWNIVSL